MSLRRRAPPPKAEAAHIDTRARKLAVWLGQISLILLAVYVLREAYDAGWLSWLPPTG